jgi:hypothetical protein
VSKSPEPRRYTRVLDCIKPRGPMSKTDFYRKVGEGRIELKHLGRRMAFVPFASADDLLAHLIETAE